MEQEIQKSAGSKKGLLIVVVLVVVLGLGGYLVLSGQKKTQENSSPEVTEGQEGFAATSEDLQKSGVSESAIEVSVEGNEYSFSPESLSLNKGERVRLTFKNTGKLPHNLTIEGLGISSKTISGGASDTIEFTATEAGIFNFYCSVGNHRGLGMEGSLEVK